MHQSKFLFRSCLTLTAFICFSGCSKKTSAPETNPSGSSASSVQTSATLVAVTNEPAPIESKTASSSGISGKIILKGTPPLERDLPLSPDCGRLHTTTPKTRFYAVGENGALADVFVHIKEGLDGKNFAPPTETVLLDQVGCEYKPYVVGLQIGQKLLIRNSDLMMHNVHAMPKAAGNKESNKAQMAKAPDLESTFSTPEIFVTYKCDVHPWMFAYVGVVEHPFFAVSGKDGMFQLKDVPDGKYVVEAIHRKAGRQTKEISVSNGKSEAINFIFEIPASL
jgi:plastocyanin